jgi:outer membrane protein assembly factor BamB
MAFDYDAGIGVYCWWAMPPGPQWCIGHEIQSIDLRTGNVLWYDMNNETTSENVQGSAIVCDRGKFAFGAHGRVWTCWDARTGKKLWTSEKTDYPWGAWWPYNQASYDFNESKGAIITPTYEGVYAIDWDTGKILWHYSDPRAVPFENPYTTGSGAAATPYFTGVFEADGKIYAYNGEHTASYPRARDWKIHCINATTGEGLWNMFNPMVPGAVADGYLVAANNYDGYMYVFGKGKSATTVTASPKTIAKGAQVLIEGTVLDQSPAQPGTPCVAKDSMETQMEYLHLQMPITGLWGNETLTGVPVILTAIGSDGNVIDIGTTTTNGYYGAFGYTWTPPKEDTYTIMASFNGDDSYGSSTAATFVSVGPAPAETPTPTPPEAPPPDNTGLIYATLAAVIVAIIIGIIAILVGLRKRQ